MHEVVPLVGSTCYCFLTCKQSSHGFCFPICLLEVHNLVTLLSFTIWSLDLCQFCALAVIVDLSFFLFDLMILLVYMKQVFQSSISCRLQINSVVRFPHL